MHHADGLVCPETEVFIVRLSSTVPDTVEYDIFDWGGVGVAYFNAFELGFDCGRGQFRYQFQPLPQMPPVDGKDFIRGYLDAWVELLVQEKIRQLNMSDPWPATPLPWGIAELLDMPVTIWFKCQKARAVNASGV